LRRRLKELADGAHFADSGRTFQTVEPRTENALRPNFLSVHGVMYSRWC